MVPNIKLKYQNQQVYSMSWLRSPMGMFGLGVLVAGAAAILNPFNIREKLGFSAHEMTYADMEQVQIERSGITTDVIPDSLTESFMGYKFLDLQSTNMLVNTEPWGPGVSDVQPRYINPYDMGYTIENELMGKFQAEGTKEFNAMAPGQQTSYLGGGTANTESMTLQRRMTTPLSYDNATTATTNIDYSGRDVVPLVPPEVNNDFPYLVSMIPPQEVGFPTVPSAFLGDNRFGDLSRNSESENLNGREGQNSLNPNVETGYMDTSTGMTQSLSVWRNQYNLIRISDTEIKAIPMSGGFETMLRRV
jgi:hypothetical protein|tara:strand:- start:1185 stop:2099 length:915 start_codon:yes stop_codon:yes gene_type:complete